MSPGQKMGLWRTSSCWAGHSRSLGVWHQLSHPSHHPGSWLFLPASRPFLCHSFYSATLMILECGGTRRHTPTSHSHMHTTYFPKAVTFVEESEHTENIKQKPTLPTAPLAREGHRYHFLCHPLCMTLRIYTVAAGLKYVFSFPVFFFFSLNLTSHQKHFPVSLKLLPKLPSLMAARYFNSQKPHLACVHPLTLRYLRCCSFLAGVRSPGWRRAALGAQTFHL